MTSLPDPFFILLLLVAIVGPLTVFYLWFFYKRDKWEHGQFVLILTIFLFGFIAIEVAGAITTTAILLVGATLATVITGPITEESLKWGVVFFGAYNRKEFNAPLDGFVFGAAAGLAFGFMEAVTNYIYNPALIGAVSGDWTLYLTVAIQRGLFNIPMHAIYTGTSCFFLGVAKFMPKGPRRYAVALGGLGIAFALHSSWNLIVSVGPLANVPVTDPLTWLVYIVVTAACWLIAANWINIGLNRSPFHPTRWTPLPSAVLGAHIRRAVGSPSAARTTAARFCPRCDASLAHITRFCPKCGARISAEAG
jgi:RsiW-degrading membrane proteinase PrsW (M82 family)